MIHTIRPSLDEGAHELTQPSPPVRSILRVDICVGSKDDGRFPHPASCGSCPKLFDAKEDAVPASYFDVDGTLVTTNLLHPTLFYLVNQQTPLRSLERVGRALWKSPRLAVAEMLDRRMFNELLFSVYEGISEDRLLLLADEAFDSVLKRSLFPEARSLVARCRDKGDVVLVSGALDFLMKRLADYLGATDVIANRLEIKDCKATGRLLRPVVAGPEKARLVREHARAKGYDLDECFAYSDSYSDVPMLSVVGHPAAVNPDARLARLARTYGWPILTLKKVPGPKPSSFAGASPLHKAGPRAS